MRHLLSSFLALHWAIVFALLAFVCIDRSRGVAAALSVLGGSLHGQADDIDNVMLVAPLATALLVVAMLFCWTLVETLANGAGTSGGVARIAFIGACGVLSLMLVGGTVQGVKDLFLIVSVQLAALLASYMAMQTEQRAAEPATVAANRDIRSVARAMARGAAHTSMLSRISGRTDMNGGDSR